MKNSTNWAVLGLVSLVAGGAVGWSAGCASGNVEDIIGADGGIINPSALGAGGGISTVPACTVCLSNADCGGGVCAQIQGESFCVSSCTGGEGPGSCPSGTTCSIETSSNGSQVSVCAPTATCAGGVTSGASSAGTGTTSGASTGVATGGSSPPACVPSSSNCDGYADPSTPSTCNSCKSSSSSCQPNGCYGGWYCDVTTSKCHAAPTGCSSGATTCPSGGGGTSPSGTGSTTGTGGSAGSGAATGTTPTTVAGTVGPSGGTVSSLLFAITGDTRPANEDDTGGYPTTIIETIFSDIAARSPQPSFVVSSGDYQFANPSGSQSAAQLSLFMAARSKFPGPWFPAMGNHECTGYTASNCGSGNTDGVTTNYSSFLQTMLGPLNQTKPYYSIKVNATDGSWTSKFVFVAANAWDSTQSSWLETTLAEATTYTFVIRHEAAEANTAPGTTPSETIVGKYPLTLEICGHTHDVSKSGNRIVMGNGGAPLTGSGDYGYGLVTQRSDGNIIVDSINYQTGAADSSFHFVVTPTGTLTQ